MDEKEMAKMFSDGILEHLHTRHGYLDDDDMAMMKALESEETIEGCLKVLQENAWDSHGAYGLMFEAFGWSQEMWEVVGPWGNWDT